MPKPLLLSVNIDHIATLRQARGTTYPDPVEAAALAEAAGAMGITVHLRGDRRHIQDYDVGHLKERVIGKLNLEMSTDEEMLRIAVALSPQQVTLVPERPEEVTTEGGLDLIGSCDEVRRAADRLNENGISVSVFIDPEPRQLDALDELGVERIPGFEINTDAYTRSTGNALATEAGKIALVSARGGERGFRVYAGHGLTSDNVRPIAAVPEIEELNIGHWIISRASLVGLRKAVQEMLMAMAAGRDDPPS